MISAIREKMGNKGLNAFIWVAVISMSGAFFLGDILKMFSDRSSWIIKANKEKLSKPEFLHNLKLEKQKLDLIKKQYGPFLEMLVKQDGISLNPSENVVSNFIKGSVSNDVANKLNLQVNGSEAIEELVSKLPPGLVGQDGKIDVSTLVSTLGTGDLKTLEAVLIKEMRQTTVMKLLQAGIYLPKFDKKRALMDKFGRKRFSILAFDTNEIETKIKSETISPEKLKSFFKEQNSASKRYWTPESREGLVYTVPLEKLSVKVKDKAIKAYYNSNKKSYLIDPAEITVKQIKFGKDSLKDSNKEGTYELYDRASNLREDLISKKVNFNDHADKKEIKIIQNKFKDISVAEAALALSKDGEISPVIESKSGDMYLLKRVSRKAPKYKELSSVEGEIKAKLVKDRLNKVFDLTMRSLSSSHKRLTDFLKKKDLTAKKISGTKDSVVSDVLKLFDIKLKNKISYYLDSANSTGYIVLLEDINKAKVKKLASIKSEVAKDFVENKVELALKSKINKIKNDILAKKIKFNKVANQPNVKLIETKKLLRSDILDNSDLREYRLAPDVLWELDFTGSITSYITKNDEFIIGNSGVNKAEKFGFLIKLDEVSLDNNKKDKDDKNLIKRKEMIIGQERGKKSLLWANGFIASLARNVNIDIKDSILKETK